MVRNNLDVKDLERIKFYAAGNENVEKVLKIIASRTNILASLNPSTGNRDIAETIEDYPALERLLKKYDLKLGRDSSGKPTISRKFFMPMQDLSNYLKSLSKETISDPIVENPKATQPKPTDLRIPKDQIVIRPPTLIERIGMKVSNFIGDGKLDNIPGVKLKGIYPRANLSGRASLTTAVVLTTLVSGVGYYNFPSPNNHQVTSQTDEEMFSEVGLAKKEEVGTSRQPVPEPTHPKVATNISTDTKSVDSNAQKLQTPLDSNLISLQTPETKEMRTGEPPKPEVKETPVITTSRESRTRLEEIINNNDGKLLISEKNGDRVYTVKIEDDSSLGKEVINFYREEKGEIRLACKADFTDISNKEDLIKFVRNNGIDGQEVCDPLRDIINEAVRTALSNYDPAKGLIVSLPIQKQPELEETLKEPTECFGYSISFCYGKAEGTIGVNFDETTGKFTEVYTVDKFLETRLAKDGSCLSTLQIEDIINLSKEIERESETRKKLISNIKEGDCKDASLFYTIAGDTVLVNPVTREISYVPDKLELVSPNNLAYGSLKGKSVPMGAIDSYYAGLSNDKKLRTQVGEIISHINN